MDTITTTGKFRLFAMFQFDRGYVTSEAMEKFVGMPVYGEDFGNVGYRSKIHGQIICASTFYRVAYALLVCNEEYQTDTPREASTLTVLRGLMGRHSPRTPRNLRVWYKFDGQRFEIFDHRSGYDKPKKPDAHNHVLEVHILMDDTEPVWAAPYVVRPPTSDCALFNQKELDMVVKLSTSRFGSSILPSKGVKVTAISDGHDVHCVGRIGHVVSNLTSCAAFYAVLRFAPEQINRALLEKLMSPGDVIGYKWMACDDAELRLLDAPNNDNYLHMSVIAIQNRCRFVPQVDIGGDAVIFDASKYRVGDKPQGPDADISHVEWDIPAPAIAPQASTSHHAGDLESYVKQMKPVFRDLILTEKARRAATLKGLIDHAMDGLIRCGVADVAMQDCDMITQKQVIDVFCSVLDLKDRSRLIANMLPDKTGWHVEIRDHSAFIANYAAMTDSV